MFKIGIFGGTFDPFTLAHREIVKRLLAQKLVDRVVVAPTVVSWHRKGYEPWLDDARKIGVIKAILDEFGNKAEIYKTDLVRRAEAAKCCGAMKARFVEDRRFVDTLMDIKASLHPAVEFYPVIGSDQYENFESWYAWDTVLKLSAGLIVVSDGNAGREGRAIGKKENPLFKDVRFLDIGEKFKHVSATALREKYRKIGADAYVKDVLKDIETGEEKLLLRTPIFDVVKGAPSGTGLEPILVKAPDWITLIAEKDGKFLIEKQYRYGAGTDITEFPCGMVEDGENPLNAAVRELEEETGIKLLDKSRVEHLGSFNPNPAFMTNTMHCFYVDLDSADYELVEKKLDDHERIQSRFVGRDIFMDGIFERVRKGRSVPGMLVTAISLYEKRLARKNDIMEP